MKADPIIRVWITKHALTQGIFETEAEHCLRSVPDGSMIAVKGDNGWRTCFHKPHWHLSRQEAVKRAIEMAREKQKSLNKQLLKLLKLVTEWGKEQL